MPFIPPFGAPPATDANLTTSDITTNNVTSTKHGFAPKSSANAAQFLNGAATPAFAAVTEANLSVSDITTNNASTSAHGFLKKLDNTATNYMDGTGAWSAPAGSFMAKLFDSTLGSDTANIDTGASGIAGGYNILEVWFIGRTDDAGAHIGIDIVVNNDTSSIYDNQHVQGENTTAAAGAPVAQAKWSFDSHGNGGTSGYASVFRMTMPFYTSTTFNKIAEVTIGVCDGTASNQHADTTIVGYRSTAAITRMKVAAQGAAKLKTGSHLIIYGRT